MQMSKDLANGSGEDLSVFDEAKDVDEAVSVFSLVQRLGKLEKAAAKAQADYEAAKVKRDDAKRRASDFRGHLKALNIKF